MWFLVIAVHNALKDKRVPASVQLSSRRQELVIHLKISKYLTVCFKKKKKMLSERVIRS